MRFFCDKNELVSALTIVQRALPARSTLSVLEGVYVSAEDDGVVLRCSDMTLQIETRIPANVEQKGVTVLGKILFDIVRHLPEGTAEFSDISPNTVQITGKNSRITVQSAKATHFPSIPEMKEKGRIRLPQKSLKNMIRQTVFATATDETKPILTGALLEMEKHRINIVALDGYRLAMVQHPVETSAEASIVLPAKSLNEISRLLGDENDIEIVFGKNYASLDLGSTMVCTQLLEGEFIRYRQILPAEYQTRAKIDRNALLESIERASILAREARNNLIRFNIESDQIVITSNSELGNAYEEIPADLSGKSLEIAFNAKYITDVLKAIPDEECYLDFNSNVSPCIVKPLTGESYLYLILPVRIYSN